MKWLGAYASRTQEKLQEIESFLLRTSRGNFNKNEYDEILKYKEWVSLEDINRIENNILFILKKIKPIKYENATISNFSISNNIKETDINVILSRISEMNNDFLKIKTLSKDMIIAQSMLTIEDVNYVESVLLDCYNQIRLIKEQSYICGTIRVGKRRMLPLKI